MSAPKKSKKSFSTLRKIDNTLFESFSLSQKSEKSAKNSIIPQFSFCSIARSIEMSVEFPIQFDQFDYQCSPVCKKKAANLQKLDKYTFSQKKQKKQQSRNQPQAKISENNSWQKRSFYSSMEYIEKKQQRLNNSFYDIMASFDQFLKEDGNILNKSQQKQGEKEKQQCFENQQNEKLHDSFPSSIILSNSHIKRHRSQSLNSLKKYEDSHDKKLDLIQPLNIGKKQGMKKRGKIGMKKKINKRCTFLLSKMRKRRQKKQQFLVETCRSNYFPGIYWNNELLAILNGTQNRVINWGKNEHNKLNDL